MAMATIPVAGALFVSVVSGCSGQGMSNEDAQIEVSGGETGGGEVVDYPTLAEALSEEGLVISGGELLLSGSPFPMDRGPFRHRYVRVTVGGHEISVLEFLDDEAAAAASATVSEDGQSIGDGPYEWSGRPHLWRSGRIIAFYVGDDDAIVESMTKVLGDRFAGG